MEEFNSETEITDENIDSVLSDVESGRETGGLVDDKPNVPVDPEFELNYKGETKKLPLSKMRDLAQQGMDYSTKMGEYNKKLADYEANMASFTEKNGRYTELDQYIQENPEWWEHVTSSWEGRDGSEQLAQVAQSETQPHDVTNDPQVQAVISELQGKLQGLESFKSQFEKQQSEMNAQKEDEAYAAEFDSIQKEYGDVEFTTPDEDGQTLEYKVLKHANDNGIQSFKTAFRDFYFDELVKRSEMKAKEMTAKDLQQINKLGLSQTTEPVKPGLTQVQNVRNKSYDDINKEILDELGQGLY
jgi:hypothetical protein